MLRTQLVTQGKAGRDWYPLGLLYLNINQLDSARYCFAKVAENQSEQPLATIGLGLADIKQGKPIADKYTWIRFWEKHEKSSDVLLITQMGLLWGRLGETEKCDELLNYACAITQAQPDVFLTAGNVYLELTGPKVTEVNNYGKACGKFEQYIYKNKENPEAYAAIAAVYTLNKNYSDAKQMVEKALELDSTWIPAIKVLGDLSYSTGIYKVASKSYTKYFELAETSKEDSLRFINVLWFNKEYNRLLPILSEAVVKHPENEVLLRLSAYTNCELKNVRAGLQNMEQFFKLRSTGSQEKMIATDYEYYGRLLSLNGNDSLAIIQFTKAYQLDSANVGVLDNMAKSYEKLKDYAMAIKSYNTFISISGKQSSATVFSIGKNFLLLAASHDSPNDSLVKDSLLNEATKAFTNEVELSPNSYLGYLWSARAQAQLDPETVLGLAKSNYESCLTLLEAKNQVEKYKLEIVEARRYLGYYYYLASEKAKTAKDLSLTETNKITSKEHWQKLLIIDPENETAKKALEAIK